jgi:hypothetical protein
MGGGGGQMRKWLGMGAGCQCSSCFHLADLLGQGGGGECHRRRKTRVLARTEFLLWGGGLLECALP